MNPNLKKLKNNMSDHVVVSPNQDPYSVSGPSDEDGYSFERRSEAVDTVYRIDEDYQFEPDDESVVLIDASDNDVTFTVDPVPAGARFTVVVEEQAGTPNEAAVEGADGVTVEGDIANDQGSVAEATHSLDGDVFLEGDTE